MNFADRLDESVHRVGSPCLLGIDPHLDLLPSEFAAAADPGRPRSERADAVERFCMDLLDVATGRIASVKPQSAFFEALGSDGVRVWENVARAARDRGLIVIGDLKRGDIGSTAAAYAAAYLKDDIGGGPGPQCDAITVNPYLGSDSVEPFLDACRDSGKGVFILVRTSNPGSREFQEHGAPELGLRVAEAVAEWGADHVGSCGLSSVGAVVGATAPERIGSYRDRMPRTPILVPGFGAQGATAADVVAAFVDGPNGPRGALVLASRSIAFAYRKDRFAQRNWKDAARVALDEMVEQVRTALTT